MWDRLEIIETFSYLFKSVHISGTNGNRIRSAPFKKQAFEKEVDFMNLKIGGNFEEKETNKYLSRQEITSVALCRIPS